MTGPKVLGLNGFGLEVPDLAAAKAFYQTFGLEAAEELPGTLRMRSPGRTNDELVLSAATGKRLHHVSFYFDPLQREAFIEKLGRAGLAVQEQAPPGGCRDGLWFRDPWGRGSTCPRAFRWRSGSFMTDGTKPAGARAWTSPRGSTWKAAGRR
ncbi:hypothetical protein CTP10_R37020 [Cupriavidus sp. P-10]|uniref:VOC family protein n=1 Tax=Cupriavidus sp. P-10 TaxID=2027911 RepID=UPI000ED4ABCC|nr:VOC family protein [Cupriavidus sp. P-10]BDB26302.1 hypothetical protein CTP10_R37020 [Cupriavidus sp. P-10]